MVKKKSLMMRNVRCFRIAVLTLFAVSVGMIVGKPQHAYGQHEADVRKASSALSPAEQKLLRSFSGLPTKAASFWGRVASSLEKPFAENVEKGRSADDVNIYKNAAPATVLIHTGNSLGSGSVINEKGEVLTNFHVIEGAAKIAVVFKPTEKFVAVKKENAYAATPIKIDKTADLALLRIHTPPANLPMLSLGNVDDLEVGQDIHAIGHPQGEVWTYTSGIISQIRPNYEWQADKVTHHRATVIQTNPDQSGEFWRPALE